MLGGDETDFSTQVPAVTHTWAPVSTSCRAKHFMPPFPEVSALVAPTRYQKPLGEAARSPSMSRGKRRSGLTSGEILPARDYRDGGAYWHRLLLGLILFRLVVPHLLSGVVVPYLVCGVWFLSHFPLEGTCCIQIFGS
jgi:hypothetical protein